jgi:fumarate reductase subunit D
VDEMSKVDWDERKRRLVDLLEPLFVAYLYVLAVLQPVLGLILGIVVFKQCRLEANKRVGKICVIISAIVLGLCVLIVLAVVIIAFVSRAAGSLG